MYNFNYEIKNDEKGEEEENPNEASLVMVSGQVKHQQNLSAKSIKKVQKVLSISKDNHEKKSKEEKDMSNFVTMSITDVEKRKRFRRR